MNLLCSRGEMEEDSTKKKVPIGAWPDEQTTAVVSEKTGLFGLYLQECRSKRNERGIITIILNLSLHRMSRRLHDFNKYLVRGTSNYEPGTRYLTIVYTFQP